ncbi:barstar family protein [Candidatus Gracilibacteria bacterium]|nr:barstar family protein [Candidatus Gracilibacteria bacterium]
MIKKIHIDLKNIETPKEFFQLFSDTFSFPPHFGNNWDAFFDVMQSLEPSADIFHGMRYPLTGIHLILSSFDVFEGIFPDEQMIILRSILVDLSLSHELRADGLSFTFEIAYTSL